VTLRQDAHVAALEAAIGELWERRAELDPTSPAVEEPVRAAVELLDSGVCRVAEVDPVSGEVVVHHWLKQAILLLFRVARLETIELGPFEFCDRLPLKRGFEQLGVRCVPGGSARWGAFLDRGVVLMPSYVNIGARVGAGTMVDTWATVGSCAQIGAQVHLSGGVGIGGVLEPPQAAPVVVEDGAFIGSRAMVTEGARVGEGAVVGAGVILNPSIPVLDAETGEELSRGVVPAWSVAISASRRRTYPGGEFYLPCVLVIKRLEPGKRHDKAELEDVLRQHGAAT
jgi:2,3,4,5-tetrahydropyridine-2-carboxylate N-succinyltransferase